jgi:hypothetical protein
MSRRITESADPVGEDSGISPPHRERERERERERKEQHMIG